jgi:hypothetical protein
MLTFLAVLFKGALTPNFILSNKMKEWLRKINTKGFDAMTVIYFKALSQQSKHKQRLKKITEYMSQDSEFRPRFEPNPSP